MRCENFHRKTTWPYAKRCENEATVRVDIAIHGQPVEKGVLLCDDCNDDPSCQNVRRIS